MGGGTLSGGADRRKFQKESLKGSRMSFCGPGREVAIQLCPTYYPTTYQDSSNGDHFISV